MDAIDIKITNPQKHFTSTPEVSRYSDSEKKKLAEASKQFESLMTSMMLKSMNQTTEGMFGDNSFGGDFFDSIFQFEIASKMSEGRNLGIADSIYQKMTGEKFSPEVLKPKVGSVKPKENINLNNVETKYPTLKPSLNSLDRLNKFDSIINEASEKFLVDKNLIKSVILAESSGKENALSKANAKGLMQLIDSTADSLGVRNVWDPRENIFGGTKYLSQLLRKYNGDTNLALAGYNAGPGNVDKYDGIPPFDETKTYVARVTNYIKNFEEQNNELL
jgi:soluble lytic murein transglycosylase-like protein